jgi:hypothetical protein
MAVGVNQQTIMVHWFFLFPFQKQSGYLNIEGHANAVLNVVLRCYSIFLPLPFRVLAFLNNPRKEAPFSLMSSSGSF